MSIQFKITVQVLFGVVVGAMNMGFCTPHLESFAKARGAAKTILPILKRNPAIDVRLGGTRLEGKLGDIEFNDVHFSYPARPDIQVMSVIQGVSKLSSVLSSVPRMKQSQKIRVIKPKNAFIICKTRTFFFMFYF